MLRSLHWHQRIFAWQVRGTPATEIAKGNSGRKKIQETERIARALYAYWIQGEEDSSNGAIQFDFGVTSPSSSLWKLFGLTTPRTIQTSAVYGNDNIIVSDLQTRQQQPCPVKRNKYHKNMTSIHQSKQRSLTTLPHFLSSESRPTWSEAPGAVRDQRRSERRGWQEGKRECRRGIDHPFVTPWTTEQLPDTPDHGEQAKN